jgi:molybdopterin/thiamine biosynthesis adenylyltransferase
VSDFTLALTGEMFADIRYALDLEIETAWTLVARRAGGPDGSLLLARELLPVPETAYLVRERLGLDIASEGYVPAFGRAAIDGGLIVFIHTHPGGDTAPSERDNVVDTQLREVSAVRTRHPLYASVIVGGNSASPRFSGRVWQASEDDPQPITRLRVAAGDFAILVADDADSEDPPPIFDRQVRAFGRDGQALLHALKIGVVGGGGTGSPVVEMLARLGAGEIVVLDDDTVDETNVTRIHESRATDIGLPKVTIAKNAAESMGTGSHVRAVEATLTTAESVEIVATCDVVFGCTDDQAGRLILSRLAYHYLVPVIDCGVIVSSVDGHVLGVHGRVTVMAPGEPCLLCRGQVDPRTASEEMMDPLERQRLAEENYAQGLNEPDPAVVAFTTATAALAVNELLARLLGYGSQPAPGQLLLALHQRELRTAGRPRRPDCRCAQSATWGLGDTSPVLDIVGL